MTSVSNILDTLINQASIEGWVILYVALSPAYMKELVAEVMAVTVGNFEVSSIAKYKEIDLKVKDIVGFQVSYQLPF